MGDVRTERDGVGEVRAGKVNFEGAAREGQAPANVSSMIRQEQTLPDGVVLAREIEVIQVGNANPETESERHVESASNNDEVKVIRFSGTQEDFDRAIAEGNVSLLLGDLPHVA